MVQFKETLSKIREVLKNQPRGLTITEISSNIDLNRNSTARYLDVLLISGQVEMKSIGSAKVYFLSPRLPLEAVLDLSREGILMLNSNLRVIRANDTFAKLIQVETHDLIGMSIEEQKIGSILGENATSSIHSALRGKHESYEIQIKANTRMHYLQVKFVPTTFDDGDAGVTIIAEDITMRKTAEAELQKQSNFLSLVMESVAHPFYVIDANDYSIKMANKAARLGTLTPDSTCYALTHKSAVPCSGDVHPCPLKEVMATGKPVIVEHTHHHVSGKTRHLEIHAHPIRDDDGNVVQMIEYNLDITKRKMTEDELQDQVQQLELIINSLSEGKLIVQGDVIVYANSVFTDIVGTNQTDVIGCELKRFVKAKHLKLLKAGDDTDTKPIQIELTHKEKRPVSVEIATIKVQYNEKPAELYTIKKIDSI